MIDAATEIPARRREARFGSARESASSWIGGLMEPFHRHRTLQSVRSGDNVSSEKSDWEAAVSGDPEAFARIFDRNRDRVFRHAYRLTGSVQDAEDVIAMVFLETWRSKSKVRVVDESVIGWLLAVANNVVRNQRRTYNRHRVAMSKLPVSEPMPDHAERVLDRIEADGANEQMRRAFTRLEQKERDVLLLSCA